MHYQGRSHATQLAVTSADAVTWNYETLKGGATFHVCCFWNSEGVVVLQALTDKVRHPLVRFISLLGINIFILVSGLLFAFHISDFCFTPTCFVSATYRTSHEAPKSASWMLAMEYSHIYIPLCRGFSRNVPIHALKHLRRRCVLSLRKQEPSFRVAFYHCESRNHRFVMAITQVNIRSLFWNDGDHTLNTHKVAEMDGDGPRTTDFTCGLDRARPFSLFSY